MKCLVANQYGIHLGNYASRTPDDVMREMLAVGFSHYTFLHHQADDAKLLRTASPSGTLCCRFYRSDTLSTDPVFAAREDADQYKRDRGGWSLQSLGVAAQMHNELNLPVEGGGWSAGDYRRINDWTLVWVAEFRRLTNTPKGLIHFGAFANGHSDDQDDLGYIGMEICRPAIEACGVLQVHCYWMRPEDINSQWYGHRFLLAHGRFPTMPLYISEAGCFDVMRPTAPDEMAAYFASLRPYAYVIGATPFLFRDPTGAHMNNDWGRNRGIETRIKAEIAALDSATPPTKPPVGGQPMPDSRIGEYARWSLARIQANEDPRDVTAFVTHLKALGANWQTPEEYGLPTVKVVPKAA